jgi:hypothetical protein
MTSKSDNDGAKTDTELEQERRRVRLAAELRANLKRRKAGHASPKSPTPMPDRALVDRPDQD